MSEITMERLTQYDAYPIESGRILCDSGWNCRGSIELQSVSQLADDIAQNGLKIPIEVQPASDIAGGLDGYDFRVNTGHRRYLAVTAFLKWPTIPSIIKYGMSELQARIDNLQENALRENLNPLQEAFAVQKIIALYPSGTTDKKIYTDLRKNFRWLRDRRALLVLPEEVHEFFASGRLAMHEIEVVMRGRTRDEQIELAKQTLAAKRDKSTKPIPRRLTRAFQRTRNKIEINALIAKMFRLGIEPKVSAARIAAWCAGKLSDEEIQADFDKILESDAT